MTPRRVLLSALLLLPMIQGAPPPPPVCSFQNAFVHDSNDLTVWKLQTLSPNTLSADCLNNSALSTTLTIDEFRSYGIGDKGSWRVNAVFAPGTHQVNGSMEYPCTEASSSDPLIRFYGMMPGQSHSWISGGNPPPLANCIFKGRYSTYHETEPEQGEWAQVVSVTNVDAGFDKFTIHSENGTFADATATVVSVAGINAIAKANLVYKDGHTATLSIKIRANKTPSSEEYQHCDSLDWTDDQGNRGFWEVGGAPVPGPRPCVSVYDESGCANAWRNNCTWCSSNDKAHNLCFSWKQADLLPKNEWSCVG